LTRGFENGLGVYGGGIRNSNCVKNDLGFVGWSGI